MEENKKEEIKKETEKVDKEIRESKKKLEEIQNNCTHEEYDIKQLADDERSSTTSVFKVCKFCKKKLGFPSKDELKSEGFY